MLSMPPDAEVVRGKRHIFLLHFVMRENFTLRNYKCTAAELSSQLLCACTRRRDQLQSQRQSRTTPVFHRARSAPLTHTHERFVVLGQVDAAASLSVNLSCTTPPS